MKKFRGQYYRDENRDVVLLRKRKTATTLSSIGDVCSTMAETLFTLVPCSRLTRILRSQVSYFPPNVGHGGTANLADNCSPYMRRGQGMHLQAGHCHRLSEADLWPSIG